MAKAKTVETVRERERESYTLNKKSTALFDSLTHTSNSIKENKGRNTFYIDMQITD